MPEIPRPKKQPATHEGGAFYLVKDVDAYIAAAEKRVAELEAALQYIADKAFGIDEVHIVAKARAALSKGPAQEGK